LMNVTKRKGAEGIGETKKKTIAKGRERNTQKEELRREIDYLKN